jgi:hypothetical protein
MKGQCLGSKQKMIRDSFTRPRLTTAAGVLKARTLARAPR